MKIDPPDEIVDITEVKEFFKEDSINLRNPEDLKNYPGWEERRLETADRFEYISKHIKKLVKIMIEKNILIEVK